MYITKKIELHLSTPHQRVAYYLELIGQKMIHTLARDLTMASHQENLKKAFLSEPSFLHRILAIEVSRVGLADLEGYKDYPRPYIASLMSRIRTIIQTIIDGGLDTTKNLFLQDIILYRTQPLKANMTFHMTDGVIVSPYVRYYSDVHPQLNDREYIQFDVKAGDYSLIENTERPVVSSFCGNLRKMDRGLDGATLEITGLSSNIFSHHFS